MEELLNAKYAIVDLECVALSKLRPNPHHGLRARIHNCTRKSAVLLYNYKEYVNHFEPCIKWGDLYHSEKESFSWCKRYLHLLSYSPDCLANGCEDAAGLMLKIFKEHDVKVIYFKGGVVELDLMHHFGLPMIDLTDHGVVKSEPEETSHNPLLEIRDYQKQMIACLSEYNNTPPSFVEEIW